MVYKKVISFDKILGCEFQDISTSISIKVKIEEMSHQDEDDESDKHLEARDRRYSCLINLQLTQSEELPCLIQMDW